MSRPQDIYADAVVTVLSPEVGKTKREGIPLKIVESALSRGATDVAAELVDERRMMIRFSNNEITISKVYREALVNVFLMIEKHRAATTVPWSSLGNMEKAVDDLVTTAKNTPPSEVYAPLPQGPFQYDPDLLKGSRVSMSPDKLTGYVQDAIGDGLKEGAQKVAGTLIATKTKGTLATSGQVEVLQEKNGLEISVRARSIDRTEVVRRAFGGDWSGNICHE
jgi:PmbA protein